MDFLTFKNSLSAGLEFHKPNVTSRILKIDNKGFTYSIGRKGNYKKVSFDLLEEAYHELFQNQSFNRIWFKERFPTIEKSASCTFTTIGGLFQHFNLATYKKGNYIKI